MDNFMISCNTLATANRAQTVGAITVQPNPSNGNISLQIADAALKNATISVYDALGKLAFTQQNLSVAQGELWALPTTLSTGIYTITAQSATAFYTQKAVVR